MKTNPVLRAFLLAAAAGCLRDSAQGALIVQAGQHFLQPNTPGQTLRIEIENTGSPVAIAGFNLNLQIADGGPSVGGLVPGPQITGVDLIAGTPFEFNHTPPAGTGTGSQVAFWSMLTATGTVDLPAGRSLLATLTVDTTGFQAPGASWPLLLTKTLNGDTQLFDDNVEPVESRFEDGFIRWTPVRDTGFSAAVPLLGLLVWANRWVSTRRA